MMIDIKYLALAALCIQNSSLILSMRYSRSVRHDTYLDSSIIVMMEFVKFLASVLLVLRDGGQVRGLMELIRTSAPVALPSVLYVIQNSCQLIAVKHLDASTFSVLSQLKVLTTALCSVAMLGTVLNARKWRALTLLVIGCVLVQYQPPTSATSSTTDPTGADSTSVTIGLVATLAMVWLSGIAGIVIERFLKNHQTAGKSLTLWERNVQLSFWGMIFGMVSLFGRDFHKVASGGGFFQGWGGGSFAVLVVLCQSVGGLVTAVVVKYTNTIIKGFAVGLSVVMTSLLSIPLFHAHLSLIFVCGAAAVLLSIFNFNEEVPSDKMVAHVSPHPTSNGTSGGGYIRVPNGGVELGKVAHGHGHVHGHGHGVAIMPHVAELDDEDMEAPNVERKIG